MPIDLEAIEARAGAATPGPWCEHPNGSSVWSGDRYDCEDMAQRHIASTRQDERGINDATFIAHAREDVPALVAEVRRLRAVMGKQALVLECMEPCWASQEHDQACGSSNDGKQVAKAIRTELDKDEAGHA